MTGAMYSAISGLKAHMSKLDVVGNNIANVNTEGYKAQRVIFSDSMYATTAAGSNGTSSTGGRNPSQMGYGVNMSAIDIDMSTGNLSPTGRGLDCMIYGKGFFLIGDKDTGKRVEADKPSTLKSFDLSRVGNFEFKSDGYLSKEDGGVVYGFMCIGMVEGEPIYSDQLVPIRLPKTQTVTTTTNGKTEETLEVKYPVANGTAWLEDATGANKEELPFADLDNITIDPSTGRISGSMPNGDIITIGVLAIANVTNPNGVSHLNGSYYKAGDGAGDVQISTMGGIGENMYIDSTNPPANASLTAYADKKGIKSVNGSQLNGATAPDGMQVYETGSKLQTGGLEASKTSLATEISNMITTQRGYQANTRIVTVTDSMLEELVNMKR